MSENNAGTTGRRRHTALAGVLAALFLAAVVVLPAAIRTPAGPASGTALVDAHRCLPATRTTLRVASFNIHSGVGGDGRADLSRIADLLRGYDLVALNEVRGRSQAKVLADMLDRAWLFAPTERQWWRDSFGNGVLCALPVSMWRRAPLESSFHRGKRNVLWLAAGVDGRTLNFLITHIDRTTDRRGQLQTVVGMFLALSPPVVLMGDLNSPPSEPVLKELLSRDDVIDALKHKAGGAQDHRIDWILCRGLRVADAGLVHTAASDHPLVWAELVVP